MPRALVPVATLAAVIALLPRWMATRQRVEQNFLVARCAGCRPSQFARVRAAALARKFDAMVARGETVGYEHYLAGAYHAGHLPEGDLDLTLMRSELLEPSPYSAIAESLFGMASFNFALRRSFFNGSPNPLGFHQDGFFSDYGYNFWTPLNDAGISSANLEVIIASGAPLFSHSAVVDTAIVDQYLHQSYSREQFWHPIIRAGDSLVFSTFMFHRTRQTPEMTQERYSIEIRGPITASVKIKGVPVDPGASVRLSSITELPTFMAQAQ